MITPIHPAAEPTDTRKGRKPTTALTHDQALARLQAVHADKDFDWSEFKYVNARSKVTIICKKHGPFSSMYDSVAHGRGCRHCGYETKRMSQRYTTEEFVSKVKDDLFDVTGEPFDYSEVSYVDRSTPVKVICKQHGQFLMHPGNAMHNKSGCPECGKKKAHDHFRQAHDDVIARIQSMITDERYSIKDVSDYTSNKSYIILNCKDHGDWPTKFNWLTTRGVCCPVCSGSGTSQGEQDMAEYIRSLGFDIQTNVRDIIPPMELDVYIPSLNLAFEFDGVYYHSDEFKGESYHLDKTIRCEQRGIRLIHVFSDEWDHNQELTKAKIAHILGKDISAKVNTRKTIVAEVPYNQAKEFFKQFHIQGAVPNQKFCYGLFLDGDLVAAASFGKLRFGNVVSDTEVELYRYAAKCKVPGGLPKILKHFRRLHPAITNLVSYSDRRWSTGDLYIKLGFSKTSSTKPSYYYTNPTGHRFDRQYFMKSRLPGLVTKGLMKTFDPNLTELENCRKNGYNRIYNCGMDRWELKLG